MEGLEKGRACRQTISMETWEGLLEGFDSALQVKEAQPMACRSMKLLSLALRIRSIWYLVRNTSIMNTAHIMMAFTFIAFQLRIHVCKSATDIQGSTVVMKSLCLACSLLHIYRGIISQVSARSVLMINGFLWFVLQWASLPQPFMLATQTMRLSPFHALA